jgi:hypothetical protein
MRRTEVMELVLPLVRDFVFWRTSQDHSKRPALRLRRPTAVVKSTYRGSSSAPASGFVASLRMPGARTEPLATINSGSSNPY